MTGHITSELSNNNNRQLGFSVLELLVSLAILVLILSFLPNTIRLGARVWERQDVMQVSAAQTSFLHYLEQRLAETVASSTRDGQGNVSINFEGRSDVVQFVAPAPAGPSGGGVYRFELTQKRLGGGRGRALILRQQTQRSRSQQAVSSTSDTIVHTSPARINNLALRYFGRGSLGEEPKWHTRWPRSDTLPKLLEIKVLRPGPTPTIERRIVEFRLRPRGP